MNVVTISYRNVVGGELLTHEIRFEESHEVRARNLSQQIIEQGFSIDNGGETVYIPAWRVFEVTCATE